MTHQWRRVLLTGAGGNLGRNVREHLGDVAGELVVTDRADLAPAEGRETVVRCELADFPAVRAMVSGVDAVVHFGGAPVEDTFEEILSSNIRGSYNIYEAARQAGVRRIVYASSIHAVGFHRREAVVGVRSDHRPDSLCGVSKCFVEDLARYYFDKFGIESVCLRINSCFPEPVDRRMLGTWLSYRDCVELVRRSLLAPRVGFTVVYGISDNSEAFVTNEGAQHIGFRPRDSAEVFRRKVEAATSVGDPDDAAVKYVGGSFCAAGHFEDP